jgi:Flp pilus assembly pilin Flp
MSGLALIEKYSTVKTWKSVRAKKVLTSQELNGMRVATWNYARMITLGRNGMNKTFRKLNRWVSSRKGQSLVEYSLILALIAIVAIVVLKGLGKKVNNTLSSVNANLP